MNKNIVATKFKHPDDFNCKPVGKNVPIPKHISNKFNWGAFFLTWVWGLFNNVYITLSQLIFLPVILFFLFYVLSVSFLSIIFHFLDMAFSAHHFYDNVWDSIYGGLNQFVFDNTHREELLFLIICFLLYFIILPVWFGAKGNVWAWKKKQYRNIQHFEKVQKIWAIAGLFVFCAYYVPFIRIVFNLIKSFLTRIN